MNATGAAGPPAPYNITVSPVAEVCLLGTADGDFWGRRLRDAGLFPVLSAGRAQLLIAAVSARFLGLRFRELPVAVFVAHTPDSPTAEGVFLAGAFSSRRLFAWAERCVNGAPYVHGKIELAVQLPASLQVSTAAAPLLCAQMSDESPARQPLGSGQDGFEGPIYLPARKRGEAPGSRLFYARTAGVTRTYAFLPADRVTLWPSPGYPVVQDLIDSGFRGHQWQLRADGVHSKSKTVKRNAERGAGNAEE